MIDEGLISRIRNLAASAQPGNAPRVCREIRILIDEATRSAGQPAVRRYYGEIEALLTPLLDGTAEKVFVPGADRWAGHSVRNVARRLQLRVSTTRKRVGGVVGIEVIRVV